MTNKTTAVAVLVLVLCLALVGAFTWYGSSMFDAGQTDERAVWQKREIDAKIAHTKMLADNLAKQRKIQSDQIKAERAAAKKRLAALEARLKIESEVKNHVENNPDVECFNANSLHITNQILANP